MNTRHRNLVSRLYASGVEIFSDENSDGYSLAILSHMTAYTGNTKPVSAGTIDNVLKMVFGDL